MPSEAHQWLVIWIGRKMIADGYLVRGVDGQLPEDQWLESGHAPPMFTDMRPDIWAAKRHTGELSIGEAKTPADIWSRHTIDQFYCVRRCLDTTLSRFYVAVPRSTNRELDNLLLRTGLSGRKEVVKLQIPDCLLPCPAHALNH